MKPIIPSECFELWRKRYRADLDEVNPVQVFKKPRTRMEDLELQIKESVYHKGCTIVDGILRDLKVFDKGTHDITRSIDQQLIHKKQLQVVLPVIFKGKSWIHHADRISKKYGIRCDKRALVVSMGRRFGKTVSMVMFMLACMRNIPNVKIVVIGNNSRSADEFMTQLKDYASRFFGMNVFEKDNEDKLFYRVNDADLRTLKVYSGLAINNLRGIGGDIVAMDEGAFFHHDTFRKIIPPLITVGKTAFICISSMHPDRNNPFNQLLESGLTDTHSFVLICKPCYEAGVRVECEHAARPAWHDDTKQELVKFLMGGSEAYQTEVLNIQSGASDSERKVFPHHLVQRFLCAPRVPLVKPVWNVIVTIDPAAGSFKAETRQSDFVIQTVAYPCMTVLGIEALDVTVTADYESILISHLTRIRKIPQCERCTFIVDVETGTGTDAGTIQKIIGDNFKGVHFINTSKNGRKPGTLTTETVKHEGARVTLEYLHKDAFSIYENFVTHPEKDVDQRLKDFGAQLYDYQKTVKNGHTKYSGKVPGRKRDDMVVTFTRMAHLCYLSQHLMTTLT